MIIWASFHCIAEILTFDTNNCALKFLDSSIPHPPFLYKPNVCFIINAYIYFVSHVCA